MCDVDMWLETGFPQHHVSRSGNDLDLYLRAHSVAAITYDQYVKAPRKWFNWCQCHHLPPTLNHLSLKAKVQLITDFVLLGFREGYGSGRPVRNATISARSGISSLPPATTFRVAIHRFACSERHWAFRCPCLTQGARLDASPRALLRIARPDDAFRSSSLGRFCVWPSSSSYDDPRSHRSENGVLHVSC
jgi:hypothetical protein